MTTLFRPALLTILSTIGMSACASTADQSADAPFDAQAAWSDVRADFDLFYAYRDDRGFDADAYLDRVGDWVETASDLAEFRRRLQVATYAFTDPHLGFAPFEATDYNIIPTSADLQIDHENGQYRIADVRAGSAADAAGLRPGWTLLSAHGGPIADAVPTVFGPLIDTPSDAQQDYAATLLANGRREGTRALTVRDASGKIRDMTLANPRELARSVMDAPVIEARRVSSPGGREVAVLRINNRLGDNDLITEFDAVLADHLGADGIILDLRNTPSGGNAEVGRSILGHFTQTLQPFQVHTRPSLEREFSVPRHYVEHVHPRAPFFDPARTVVLGGYWTGSMGEGIVIGMDALGVQVIASDMGDLLGGMSQFSFVDGAIRLSIPTEALFHVDGTPREDFVANLRLRSADRDENGGDPALKAALDYLDQD